MLTAALLSLFVLPTEFFRRKCFEFVHSVLQTTGGVGGRNWSFSSFMGKTQGHKKEKCRHSSITVFSSGETKESLYGRGRPTKHRGDCAVNTCLLPLAQG